jgi:hypothetical protein
MSGVMAIPLKDFWVGWLQNRRTVEHARTLADLAACGRSSMTPR